MSHCKNFFESSKALDSFLFDFYPSENESEQGDYGQDLPLRQNTKRFVKNVSTLFECDSPTKYGNRFVKNAWTEDDLPTPTVYSRSRIESISSPNLLFLQPTRSIDNDFKVCNCCGKIETDDCCDDLLQEKNQFDHYMNDESAISTNSSELAFQYQPRSANPLDDLVVLETLFKSQLSPTEVTLVQDPKSLETFVIKQTLKSKLINDQAICQARDEAFLHKQLNHTNIVRILDSWETDKAFILALEFCENFNYFEETLNEYTSPIQDIDFLRELAKQLVSSLDYLHTKAGIIHCDLKPKNIGLSKRHSNIVLSSESSVQSETEDEIWDLKLFDFGLARSLDLNDGSAALMTGIAGTHGYIAPEIVEKNSKQTFQVTPKVDMWSLGIILFQMAVGYSPFRMLKSKKYVLDDPKKLFDKRDWLKFQQPLSSQLATDAGNELSDLQDLIFKCLQKDPDQRPTAAQALAHPFFSQQNGNDDQKINNFSAFNTI